MIRFVCIFTVFVRGRPLIFVIPWEKCICSHLSLLKDVHNHVHKVEELQYLCALGMLRNMFELNWPFLICDEKSFTAVIMAVIILTFK